MTDGRFPERCLNDRRFSKISAEAFRLFVVANTWSASNRTDGAIGHDDLVLFPRWVRVEKSHELVDAGLWITDGAGWHIAGYAHSQTTAAQLDAAEHARMLARERKARERARNRVWPADEPVTRDITRDVLVDDTGQARTGRPGQEVVPRLN